MDSTRPVEIIKNYFEDKSDVLTVYLFGSTVKGTARDNSDIDIGVLFIEDSPPLYRFERKLEITNDLEDLLGISVDVIDLESADLFFIHQVMLNKRILTDKNIARRVIFEVEKRREYFDRKSFYDVYHSQALKRLEEKKEKIPGWLRKK